MTAPVLQDATFAVFEAEILYLCADLGGDVLSRAIGVVEMLHADAEVLSSSNLADASVASAFKHRPLMFDATG